MNAVDPLLQDARIAFRVLRKSGGTTALAVMSVALGIGLTTALFSVADAILLRPFPLRDAAGVLQATSFGDDGRGIGYGWPDFEDISQAAKGSAEVATYERKGAILTVGDESEFVLAYAVSPNFFPFIGVPPTIGQPSLDAVAGRPSAVISYRLWQRRFAGDPSIIDKTIKLNNRAFRIAAVMPREFTGMARLVSNDVWVRTDAWFDVLGRSNERTSRDGRNDFEIVARLKPGVSAATAAAQFDAAIRGPAKYKNAPKGVTGTYLDARFAPGWRASLFGGGALLILLGLVLFAACANVAQLRLAHAEGRRKELGVRLAIGAGAWRVIRQVLVETAMLTVAGAALGVVLAQVLMEKVVEFAASRFSYIDTGIRLDSRVLAFAIAATAVAILFSGFAPARHTVRLSVSDCLKSEQGTTGSWRSSAKRVLIAAQITIGVVLFGMATMFVQSLNNVSRIQPGLDPTKRLLIINPSRGSNAPTFEWCRQACERLSALPGIRAATFARRLPLSGSGGGLTVRVELPGQSPLGVGLNNVASNYFKVMGTRVLAGRGIDDNDREGSPPVVVISQRLARQAFNNRNPLGQWMRVEGKLRQVVGITENAPANDLHEDPEPYVYLPFSQMPSGDFTLIAETAGNPELLQQPARRELKRFDPGMTAISFTTLRRHIQQALTTDVFLAAVTTSLGGFGFVLTATGLFGVIHYTVRRRTREIGLRMSLGANASQIQSMVLGESLRMAAWAIPIGLVLLAGAGWCIRSLVLGVTPLDPSAYVASTVLAVSVALLAAWIPARSATRVDPMAALRSE